MRGHGHVRMEPPASRWTVSLDLEQPAIGRARNNGIGPDAVNSDVPFGPGRVGRTKTLLLAALRVWELKNGIQS